MKQISKGKPLQRIMAFCLCLSMTLVLFLPGDVLAALWDPYSPSNIGSVEDLDTNYSGFVVRYNAPNTGDNQNGAKIIRVDFGLYHLNNTSSLDFAFKYDPSKVKLANYKSGTIAPLAVDEFSGVSNIDKQATVVPILLPEAVVAAESSQKNNIINSYTFANTAAGLVTENSAAARHVLNLQTATIDVGVQGNDNDGYQTDLNGNIGFSMTSLCQGNLKSHNKMIKDTNIIGTQDVDVPVYIASLYFIADDMTKVDYETFHMAATTQSETGAAAVLTPSVHTRDVTFVGFPAAPEKEYDVTFTVKAGSKVLPGATVEIVSGTSTEGTNVADRSGVTDENGVATIKLPVSNSSGYRYKVKNVDVGGTTYTMGDNTTLGVKIDVKTGTDATRAFTYDKMEEVEEDFSVNIRAVNAAGEAVSLKDATVQLGTKAADTAAATAENGVTVSTVSGGQTLQITGVPGYQNINVSNAITVTPDGSSLTDATLSQGTAKDPNITVEGSGNNQTGQYVKVKLPLTVTNVTMPLPVPQVDGKNITVEQAKGMTLTFVPKQGSSKALLAEVGSGVTVSGSAITVTADTTDSTLASAISANASLPDGAYTLTIGGAGFESKELPVTVITDNNTTPPTRVVNVGGDATLDGSGGVTQIEGGVTGSTNTGGSTDQGTGNGSIDLSGGKDGTTIVEGGTTNVSGGSVTPPSTTDPGVTDKTNDGLANTDTAGGMKPSVVTDPIYLVKVKANQTASTQAYETFTVEVRLKNAVASSGTFGLYFDPNIFGAPSSTDIVPNAALNIEANNALETAQASGFANPEIEANHQGSGYVFYGWQVAAGTGGGNTAVDGRTSDGALLATITLPVKSTLWNETALKAAIAKRSIYTMDYTQTKSGQYIAAQMQTSDLDAYGEAIGNAWRMTGTAGSKDSVHLDDAKATRGGFYQFSAPETIGEGSAAVQQDVMHDIRMDFELPELMSDHRVDFWVTERDGENPGTGVGNAEIRIYEAPYDPEADPAMTPIQTLTTNPYGYAYVKLDQGKTYYYTVTEAGHWSYPNGTPKTDQDNMNYDAFRITDSGVEMVAVPTTDGSDAVITKIERDYINPRMDPTTYHKVDLKPQTDGQDPHVSITSAVKAYNGVDYYFTLKPDAGYEWDTDTYSDMDAVAAKLTATLYKVKADAADEAGAFHTDELSKNIQITWDAAKEKFKLSGTDIAGDSIGANSNNLDPLRAGDLDILATNDLVKAASYTIKATAGTGGTFDVALDNTLGSTDTDMTAVTGQTVKVETLSNGRTVSSVYTFKPNGTNLIGKVLINGVEQTLTQEQKKAGYTYQFLNISSDQTIHVTFTDKDGTQLSDPYLSVTAGDHGSVAVTTTGSTATPVPGGTVTGPDTQSFDLKDSTGLTVTVTPDKDGGYEIDAVVVDGKVLTDAEKASALETDTENPSKQYYTKTLTLPSLSLNDGDTHSVVVTFKPKGQPSTQAIVTATVVKGFGTLSPVGATIYPIDATPEYLMTPAAGWTVDTATDSEAVKVDGTDYSDQVTAPTAGQTAFRYTLPPLKGNTKLDVTFSEVGYTVQGKIQIKPKVGNDASVAAATLTFVRAAVPGETDETTVKIISGTTAAANPADSGATKLLSFDDKVPVGKWTVTVHKQGYLDYIIRDFEVKKGVANTIYFGDSTCDGGLAAGSATAIKPIPLTPGDASGDGRAIAFGDASMVVAGWLKNALPRNKLMSDIDESNFSSGAGGSDGDDMSLVRQNMYKSRVFNDYTTFCTPVAGS